MGSPKHAPSSAIFSPSCLRACFSAADSAPLSGHGTSGRSKSDASLVRALPSRFNSTSLSKGGQPLGPLPVFSSRTRLRMLATVSTRWAAWGSHAGSPRSTEGEKEVRVSGW